MIAEHFERGGQLVRAANYYVRAAAHCLENPSLGVSWAVAAEESAAETAEAPGPGGKIRRTAGHFMRAAERCLELHSNRGGSGLRETLGR